MPKISDLDKQSQIDLESNSILLRKWKEGNAGHNYVFPDLHDDVIKSWPIGSVSLPIHILLQ